MHPEYHHRQTGWMILAGLTASMAVVVPLVAIPAAPLGAVLVAALVLLGGVLFATLTVEVDARELRVFFTGGLVRKRVALAEILSVQVVRNPWYYGLGIHKIPRGWIWNVSGRDGVELRLRDGSVLRIGSDEPAALRRAIEAAAPKVAWSAAEAAPATRRSRASWLVLALAFLAVGGLASSCFYLQTRPPRVTVTPAGIAIASLFYGDEYPMSEVTDLSLEPRLPRLLRRTNGFAGGGLLRGWFRVEGLGEGKLFVDLGYSPYLLVRLRKGFVIVNFADPRKTRALYQQIQEARAAR